MTVTTMEKLLEALENDEEIIKIKGDAFNRISQITTEQWMQLDGGRYRLVKRKVTPNFGGILGFIQELAGDDTTGEENEIIKLLTKWYYLGNKGNSFINVVHR